MRSIDASLAEAVRGASGRGVRVLIVDSGVERGHPALRDRDIPCRRVVETAEGAEVIDEDGVDPFGHGTAIASILCAHAPGASIESLRVLGGDLRTTSRRVLAGLAWALEQGYDVLNCSFGTQATEYLAAYKRFTDLAFCRNVIVVASCNNADPRAIEYPSGFPTVISTDCASLSPLTLRRRRGELVELVAHGERVRVAWRGGAYRESTGASFAAPHIAAIVARLREVEPVWNACEMKAALYRLAETEVATEDGRFVAAPASTPQPAPVPVPVPLEEASVP